MNLHALASFRFRPLLFSAGVILAGLGGTLTAAGAEGKSPRPNILFIIVDDQAALDFRVYNPRSTLETPNIDRLAAEGIVFDDAYHMGAFISAVCTPSRHMIKCGRTLWHLPIAPEASRLCPPALEQNTIAAVFNRAGYDTSGPASPATVTRPRKRCSPCARTPWAVAASRPRAAPGTAIASWNTLANAKRQRTETRS
jgi:hypothetical protein